MSYGDAHFCCDELTASLPGTGLASKKMMDTSFENLSKVDAKYRFPGQPFWVK